MEVGAHALDRGPNVSPASATSQLCFLGEVTLTLCTGLLLCKMETAIATNLPASEGSHRGPNKAEDWCVLHTGKEATPSSPTGRGSRRD